MSRTDKYLNKAFLVLEANVSTFYIFVKKKMMVYFGLVQTSGINYDRTLDACIYLKQ